MSAEWSWTGEQPPLATSEQAMLQVWWKLLFSINKYKASQGLKPHTSRQFYPSSSLQRKKDNHHHHLQACILLTVESTTKNICKVLNDPRGSGILHIHTQINKNQPTFPVVFLFHQLQLYVGMWASEPESINYKTSQMITQTGTTAPLYRSANGVFRNQNIPLLKSATELLSLASPL